MFALGAIYVPGGMNTAAILTPSLAVLPFAMDEVYVFLNQQGTSGHLADSSVDVRPTRQCSILAVALVVIAWG